MAVQLLDRAADVIGAATQLLSNKLSRDWDLTDPVDIASR